MNAVMVGTCVLLSMCLILAGLANLQGLTTSIMFRDRIGIAPWLWRLLGTLYLVSAAGLIVGALASPRLVVVSGAIAAVLLIVVLLFQRRSRAAFTTQVPVLVLLAFAVVAIGCGLALS